MFTQPYSILLLSTSLMMKQHNLSITERSLWGRSITVLDSRQMHSIPPDDPSWSFQHRRRSRPGGVQQPEVDLHVPAALPDEGLHCCQAHVIGHSHVPAHQLQLRRSAWLMKRADEEETPGWSVLSLTCYHMCIQAELPIRHGGCLDTKESAEAVLQDTAPKALDSAVMLQISLSGCEYCCCVGADSSL